MYKKHITGLKGFACLMIMLGHFFGVFAYSEVLPFDVNYIGVIRETKLGFIIDESYWLYLFFIISGYLLAFSNINSGKQLFAKFIQRFLRLGLPIFFSYVIIYIIYLCIGFHNSETISLFENSWFQNAYSGEYSFVTVMRSFVDVLIFGKTSLNSPYWVLREMFIASLLIYAVTFIGDKLKEKSILKIVLVGLVALGSVIVSKIIFFCFAGTVLAWCEQNIANLIKKQWFFFAIILCSLALTFLGTMYRSIVFFAALIIFVPRVAFLNKIFSSKLFEFIGKISFGIYSFHWPIYCSVGALIMVSAAEIYGLAVAIIVAMIVSAILTVLISWLYSISCEKFSDVVVKKSYSFLVKTK